MDYILQKAKANGGKMKPKRKFLEMSMNLRVTGHQLAVCVFLSVWCCSVLDNPNISIQAAVVYSFYWNFTDSTGVTSGVQGQVDGGANSY